MSISWLTLIFEVELLVEGPFLTEKFQQNIESEDYSFATLRDQEFFGSESSITDDS